MTTKKNPKSRRTQRPYLRLKALLAIALMLGAILAGLLMLSYPPMDKNAGPNSDKSSSNAPKQGRYPDTTEDSSASRYPDSHPSDKSTEPHDTPQVTPRTSPAPEPDGAHIAIIMDDLGASLETAEQVARLEIPITMAIIPDLQYASSSMNIAAQYGKEVMVHLPMEPLNYPHHNPGEMALMLKMGDAEIKNRTAYYLHKLPLAKGCNNHMGSAFTQKPHKMATVLRELSNSGLYFIDSLTTSTSVGAKQAHKLQVPSATRDVFLDNERDVGKITNQLIRLLRIAQKNGSSIGICHPHPETITALNSCASLAAEYGVTVVPASKLVR